MKNIKILIGCILFKELTGSEMYVYELAKGLLKYNYDVSIVSPNIGGILTNMAIKDGIKVYDFNTLNKNEKFDLIHCQHTPITQHLINLYPITKKICTIHSEVNSLETPIQHFSIFKYIAIRPEIKKYIIEKHNIPEKQITVIYNPIDDSRFNNLNTKDEGFLLFVGTIDYLRKSTIFDLVELTKRNNQEFWLVGKNMSDYLNKVISNNHVRHFQATSNIENFVKNCSVTSGILLGRTTIEGWMCGKPGWIYNIDQNGIILNKNLYTPPLDIEKFYSSNVINQINNEYKNILNNL